MSARVASVLAARERRTKDPLVRLHDFALAIVAAVKTDPAFRRGDPGCREAWLRFHYPDQRLHYPDHDEAWMLAGIAEIAEGFRWMDAGPAPRAPKTDRRP